MNIPQNRPVVMVDDEKSYTDLMSQMLEEHLGARVIGYTRPLDALHALPDLQPGVIVTDYSMPGLDGLEFIRQASSIVPDAAFILITGHNLDSHAGELERLGRLKSFLPKPFGWRTLAGEILRVWPRHEPEAPRSLNAVP